MLKMTRREHKKKYINYAFPSSAFYEICHPHKTEKVNVSFVYRALARDQVVEKAS